LSSASPSWARLTQVALRTVHITAMGLVLGGVALGAGHGRLRGAIAATLLSGVLLMVLDLVQGSSSLHQGSGAALLLKLLLLGLGNVFPQARLQWYLAATAVASVGAHMPGRWRHFSFLYWRVLER